MVMAETSVVASSSCDCLMGYSLTCSQGKKMSSHYTDCSVIVTYNFKTTKSTIYRGREVWIVSLFSRNCAYLL